MAQARGVYKGPVLDKIQTYKDELNSAWRLVAGTHPDRKTKLELLEQYQEGDDLIYLFVVLCTAYDIKEQRSTLRDVVAKEALLQMEQFLAGFIETLLLLLLMKNVLTQNYFTSFVYLLLLATVDQIDKAFYVSVSNIKANNAASPTQQLRDNCKLYFEGMKSNPSETVLMVEEKNKNIYRLQTNVTLFSTYLLGKSGQLNRKMIAPLASQVIQKVASHDFRADGRLFAAYLNEWHKMASEKFVDLKLVHTDPVVTPPSAAAPEGSSEKTSETRSGRSRRR